MMKHGGGKLLLPVSFFMTGKKVMAIELHQSDAASSEVELIANTKPGLFVLKRGGNKVEAFIAGAPSLPDQLKIELRDLFAAADLSPEDASDFYWLSRAVRCHALGELEAAREAIGQVSEECNEQIDEGRVALTKLLR